jgi:AcrR family transcriptional regulator
MAEPPAVDRRTRRTKRALQTALLNLAEERDLESITVREITDLADINRATFYQHYRDKDDLVSNAFDALFDEVTAEDREFTDKHQTLSPDVVPAPLVTLFKNLHQRRHLFSRLFSGADQNGFVIRLQLFEQEQFVRVWNDMALVPIPGSPPVEVRGTVATGIVRSFVAWWLKNGEEVSVETAAEWLWNILKPLWFSETGRLDTYHQHS